MRIDRTIFTTQRVSLVLHVDDESTLNPLADARAQLTIVHDGNQQLRIPVADAIKLGQLLVALPILESVTREAERVSELCVNAAGDEEAFEEADKFANDLSRGEMPLGVFFPGAGS